MSFFAALTFAALYALSDEIHQMFVYDRKGRIQDVLLDCLGILSFLLIITQLYLGKLIKKFIVLFFVVLMAIFFLVASMMHEAKDIISQRNYYNDPEIEINEEIEDADVQEETAEDPITTREDNFNDQQEDAFENNNVTEEIKIPESVLLDVPFSSQAPFAVWDDVHEEACEETSLIMIKYYLDGKNLTPQIAEDEIQSLKEYQLSKTGDYHDSTMEELVDIAEDYYGIMNLEVIYDFAKQDIKKELARGNPVIVPMAGRELGNPNFKQPGPLYHNLVVKGYVGNVIITNDPGTRKGEGFEYHIDTIFDAIHDFPGAKENILQGRKAMIVIR